jgi:hypothetical protein
MVFLAGLPGTGKSFFIHRVAHFAHAAGRTVHLLQWDVARPAFENSPAGQRHPTRHGVTDPVIRKAAGAWARRALVRWHDSHADPAHLLIGETPLVGHRFIELARPVDDAAERFLVSDVCCFVIPVPSVEVRRALEAERDRRMRRPLHDHEREDAPPHVLRALWDEVVEAARMLGIGAARRRTVSEHYDPALYERVYRHVLAHRRVEVIPVNELLHSVGVSVYAFAVPKHDIVPTPEEAVEFIHAVEEAYPDVDRLRHEMDRWYLA